MEETRDDDKQDYDGECEYCGTLGYHTREECVRKQEKQEKLNNEHDN